VFLEHPPVVTLTDDGPIPTRSTSETDTEIEVVEDGIAAASRRCTAGQMVCYPILT